jgi:hypothetical protein
MEEETKYFHDMEFFKFVVLIIEDPFRKKDPKEVRSISRRTGANRGAAAGSRLWFLQMLHRDLR